MTHKVSNWSRCLKTLQKSAWSPSDGDNLHFFEQVRGKPWQVTKTGVVKKSLPLVHQTRLASWFKTWLEPHHMSSEQLVAKSENVTKVIMIWVSMLMSTKTKKQPSKTVKLIFWTNTRQVTNMGVVDSSNFLCEIIPHESNRGKKAEPFFCFSTVEDLRSRGNPKPSSCFWAEDSCP